MNSVVAAIRTKLLEKYGSDACVIPSDEKLSELLTGHVKLWVPTGLDDGVLGREGYGLPFGRIAEIFGPESHGKSSIVYYLIGRVQRRSGYAMLIDSENSYDTKYGKTMGIDNKSLVVVPLTKESSIERYLDMIVSFLEEIRKHDKKGPIIIAWDTLVCTPTEEQLEKKSFRDKRRLMGLSRAMSEHLPALGSKLAHHNALLILVNQVRDNVGVMFGEKYTTPGGHAVKHLATLRLFVKKVSTKGSTIESIVYNKKNKVGPPYKQFRVRIAQDGISLVKALAVTTDEE